MSTSFRYAIVVGVFVAMAFSGIVVSLAAPHLLDDDELVYLTGALQARDGDLPDAYMLQGYDYGPYLQPKIMLALYEPMGHDLFKSVVLLILVLTSGCAAYALFRLLGLPWVPSLLLSAILLLPRTAAGTEFFGLFAFNEAIGRSAALPLFFLGSAFILRRLCIRRSTWPVFAVIGLCIFLHPVTVTLFAFISLIGVGVTRLVQRTGIVHTIREVAVSGIAFLVTGSYFFVDVVTHLSKNVSSEGVSTVAYVNAVLFRNAWEFPAASLLWYRHMLVVSLFFILFLGVFYGLPAFRAVRKSYALSHAKELLVWGATVAVGSLVLTLAIPGLNLYLMEHADASYMFQQWSRMSKFYYLGLFVMLVPAVYTLWKGYVQQRTPLKTGILVFLVLGGLASSTLAFEVVQFAIGYKNFAPSYIPQALSHIPDGTTVDQYRETCRALEALGATSTSNIVSHDFGLRYFCKANLFVTGEEGAAYTYLERADLIWWHKNYLAQRDALRSGALSDIRTFATSVDADFVVLTRDPKYEAIRTEDGLTVVTTTRHIILKLEH